MLIIKVTVYISSMAAHQVQMQPTLKVYPSNLVKLKPQIENNPKNVHVLLSLTSSIKTHSVLRVKIESIIQKTPTHVTINNLHFPPSNTL
jgi:hypothetical protein